MDRYDDWFASLPPERQAQELNHASDWMGSSRYHVVVGGQVVEEGA